MNERRETGRCFCGAIEAEMIGEPFWIALDHDDDCRRAVGGPMMAWVGYRPSQVTIAKGAPKRFSKTPGVVRSFCGECGSAVAYADEGSADELYIAIGFFDRPEAFPPMAHAYWSMRLPWLDFADGLDRVDGYSRKRDPAVGTPADRQKRGAGSS